MHVDESLRMLFRYLQPERRLSGLRSSFFKYRPRRSARRCDFPARYCVAKFPSEGQFAKMPKVEGLLGEM
jgi:hypothetical protein